MTLRHMVNGFPFHCVPTGTLIIERQDRGFSGLSEANLLKGGLIVGWIISSRSGDPICDNVDQARKVHHLAIPNDYKMRQVECLLPDTTILCVALIMWSISEGFILRRSLCEGMRYVHASWGNMDERLY